MTAKRGLGIIIATGAGFGAAGGLLGLALGLGAPGYYRGVFGRGDGPGFGPWRVGVGLGLNQGLICGLVVGSAAVIAEAFWSRHRVTLEVSERPEGPARHRPSRVWLVFGLLAMLALGGAIGCAVGAILGQLQIYRLIADGKRDKIQPILRDPRFATLRIGDTLTEQLCLKGQLRNRAAYKALEEKLRFLFGDDEAKFMMSCVEVAGE